MPKTLTDEEYFASLSRKVAGAGVIFQNADGNILLVKPDYREDWLLPGGSIDEDESPLACAIREVQEEIGLTIPTPRFLGTCYSKREKFSDGLMFFFYGGILSEEEIDNIVLKDDELLEYRFMTHEEIHELASNALRTSLEACMKAIESGTAVYVEK